MDENTLSMAEKMNQLYQEREEQYKKREKLFDDRSKQLQSLANALEKQKNSQEQKATDLDNREKELDQIQDALAAKVEDMEKQETALKTWEQETKESLAKAKQEQENELIKKRQELQMEKLQAQNLSIELQAERDNLKMMQENLKLYPDMSLPTDKETELQAKIETLQSRLSMAEKERDSKMEQMEKLQKDFDAKEDELANLQLKAEDSSTDPEVEEKLRKRNGELQGKVIELNKQVKSLQRDLDDQAKDKEELQRQLEENSNQPESHDLSAEELQNYLLTLPEFENVTTRHNTDGIIVDAVCGEKNYHFRFDSLPFLGATLVSVFFMVNFFKETTDIKHGMTMEASIQFFIKLALVDAVFLNLTNILVFLIEIEQAFFGIIVPEDAASLVIRVGDDWEMSGSGLIFGNLFGIVFFFICLGGAVLTLWTVYRVFLKLFFYMAVAPLALSTYAGPHEIGHTGSSWVRTFLCALFEMTGIMLMMRLGTILINAGGLFPTASEDILGGMLGSQGWEGLQAILGILIITGSVSDTDAMIRRAFGF